MLISHKNKYIFCHIPKVGGSSLYSQLLNIDSTAKVCDTVTLKKWGLELNASHISTKALKLVYGANIFSNYYLFSIVRNPYDRFISQYWYFRTGLEHNISYIKVIAKNLNKDVSSLDTFIQGGDITWTMALFYPQSFFCTSKDKIKVDIFKYEDTLDAALQEIIKKINTNNMNQELVYSPISYRIHSEHRRQQGHYREVLSSMVRKYIEKKYQKDFELFNYSW